MSMFMDSLQNFGFSSGKYTICVPFLCWGLGMVSPNPSVLGTLKVLCFVPLCFCQTFSSNGASKHL